MSPSMPLARDTVRALVASQIREVANAGMGRADVLPFWFGESDEPTASYIRQAASQSIERGETFYTQNLGRPYLREGLARYLSALHGRVIDANCVAVTGSGVSALMLAAQAIVSPGDHVVAVTPLWPNLVEIPRILGANVQRVGLKVRANRWQLDLDELFDALKPTTRALLVNSPNNPTGWTIDEASLNAVAHHCRQRGIWLVADDVYERLYHVEGRASAPSFLKHADDGDRLISCNSFSKAWSMTGWRVGWMVAPPALMNDVAKLLEYNTSCVAEPVQRAAAAALEHGDSDIVRLQSRLKSSRAMLVKGLRALPGVDVPDADGAMYAFFRVQGERDSLALAKRMVSQIGLGLAPGAAFGPEGEGWLRWCHAVDESRLHDGLQRLARCLGRHGVFASKA